MKSEEKSMKDKERRKQRDVAYFLCSDGFSSQFSGSFRSSLWTVALSRCNVLMSSSSCSCRTLSDVSFGYISHDMLHIVIQTQTQYVSLLICQCMYYKYNTKRSVDNKYPPPSPSPHQSIFCKFKRTAKKFG